MRTHFSQRSSYIVKALVNSSWVISLRSRHHSFLNFSGVMVSFASSFFSFGNKQTKSAGARSEGWEGGGRSSGLLFLLGTCYRCARTSPAILWRRWWTPLWWSPWGAVTTPSWTSQESWFPLLVPSSALETNKKSPQGPDQRGGGGAIIWTPLFARYSSTSLAEWTGA